VPKFSANLTFLFAELPFTERFGAAAEAGFTAVEYMFPYEFAAVELRARLDAAGLEQVLFNLPAGDWDAGDRGVACDPDRVQEFRDGVAQALEYADVLDVERLNCLSGKTRAGVTQERHWEVLVENVRYAAGELARSGRTLLVEQVNALDNPGFLLSTTGHLARLLSEVGAPNLRVQLDLFHVQRAQGNLCESYDTLRGQVAHVQIAENPGRHQPGTGEIDYRYVLAHIDASGYDGWVGLEYVPDGDTVASLGWLQQQGLMA
jgi:hydroxypyruvate isomerase